METTQQVAYETERQRWGHFVTSKLFPPGSAEQRDLASSSHGLIKGYELKQNKEHDLCSEHLPTAELSAIRLPNLNSFAHAAAEIVKEPFFVMSDAIMVLTDSDPLSSDRIMKHFEKLGPILFDRTTIQGPFSEQWAIAFHRSHQHDDKVHCTWAAVFLLEALMTAVPWKHYILQDHDDAPLSLFEMQQLVNFVKIFHLPYFTSNEAHPGMITISEENSPNNAGQVFFPARSTRRETANMPAEHILNKLKLERAKLVSRKFQTPQTKSFHMDGSVLEQNQAPTLQQHIDLLASSVNQTRIPHVNPGEKTWEHLHEDKLKLLGGTPLYRSQADAVSDYIHAWAMLGEAACALGFTKDNNLGKSAHDTFVPPELQSLVPPLTVWAGPFFEQPHLATLKALDSYSYFSVTLPGPNFFMQKHVLLEGNEQFLVHNQNPYEQDTVLLPAGIHAHGKNNKKYLSQLSFTMWMPLDITLSGIGRAKPFFCRNQDSIDVGLSVWMRAKGVEHREPMRNDDWKRRSEPIVSNSIAHDQLQQKLLAQRFPIFSDSKFQPPDTPETTPSQDRHRSTNNARDVHILCNGLNNKRPSLKDHDIVIGNKSGYRQCYGFADRKKENCQAGLPTLVAVNNTPNHITDAAFLFYNMPATKIVWELMFQHITQWTLPTTVLCMPSWLAIPESHYLLAVAIQINQQAEQPMQQLRLVLNGHRTHYETNAEDRKTYFSPHSTLVPALRQSWLGSVKEDNGFSQVCIEGFSAGSLIGICIFRLLAETGAVIKAMPSKVTLGAIAMSPLLFFNFFELGRKSLPSIPPDKRLSTWNPEKQKWQGITFVHYLRDLACPFQPTTADQAALFECNAHKIVLLQSAEPTYGDEGHSYSHEYLGLAGLQSGTHQVHKARMQVEVGDTQESMALLMVELLLTMGTGRLHTLLKTLVNAPDQGSLHDLLTFSELKLTEEEQSLFDKMAHATIANSGRHTAWLWGTILPSISSRAAADAAEKGHTHVPIYQANATVAVRLKFDHKLAHNAYLVYLTVTGGQNEWAIFQATTGQNRGKPSKLEYQTGIFAGDVLTLQVKLDDYQHFRSPLPEFTQCQAFVIRKSLRKRSGQEPTAQADVQSMQLAFKFPEQLELAQWQPRANLEFITQYDGSITKICKLTKLPTPNAWAKLTQLPEPQLALLSQKTANPNANDWPSPPRPKAETAALCFMLMESQLKAFPQHHELLQSFVKTSKSRGRSAEDTFRAEILKHAFDWFGHLSGTDPQNIVQQAAAHGPEEDRLQLLHLAKTHPWVCLAYYSPILYLDFLQLFLSEDETFKLLIAHIMTNAHFGSLAAHIQGIAGAGKTYQVMAIMTASHYLADLNTLWVTKLNNPLYTAALAAQRYLPKEGVLPENQIIRVLATSHDDHTTPVDVKRTTKKYQWPSSGLVILTSGLAATYLDFNPHLGNFFCNCDVVIFDEAQQFGAEDEAILFTTLPTSVLFIFIGDPEQPTGSASNAFAQLVIKKIAEACPGLRSKNIIFRAGTEYIDHFLNTFDKPGTEDASIGVQHSLLHKLLSPLFDNVCAFIWTNYHKIGWDGIGGLVIPYCVRCHDLNTLLWALPTYHSLFKGPSSNS